MPEERVTQVVRECTTQFGLLAELEEQDRIDAINQIRLALHAVSPMSGEPVDCVLWVRSEEVTANDYNPNTVAPPEMELLRLSIEADGYTQPIVTFPEGATRTTVDGFHRGRVGKECESIRTRVKGRLPVTTIRPDREERNNRIASTIRHNRARGKHGVEAMSQIVMELTRRNWSEERIAKELGMDADEVLRLRQVTGLAEMFKHREFSEAWETV
ncbi:MAG: hypothetical protein EBR82_29935 [Caulobacteraceae bacterium]|nr:hypothetical protein [Caulobacteraceae bacterium]